MQHHPSIHNVIPFYNPTVSNSLLYASPGPLTFHPCHTLPALLSSTSSNMHISSTSLYHIISHHTSFPISYFIFLVFKRAFYIHFIILADDGCNTAIESFQTDRLLRVFHSSYFHYSCLVTPYSETHCPLTCIVYTHIVTQILSKIEITLLSNLHSKF